MNLQNVYANTNKVSQIFPSGDYKVIADAVNEKNETLAVCWGFGSVISPDKQSFG